MKETTLSITYGRALIEALSPEECQSVHEGFHQLVTLFRENPSVPLFLTNPFVSQADKKEIINTIAGRIGIDGKLLNFFFVLIREDRMAHLEDIYYSFDRVIKSRSDTIEAEVESAIELNSDELEKIKRILHRRFKKDIKLTSKLDPQILAGIRIRVGDKIIDSSVSNNLQQLRQALSGG